jgi:hypothetical protein
VSYIRATSSPEGLYAFSTRHEKTGRAIVELIPAWEYKLTNANNDHPLVVPQAVFDTAVKLWDDEDYEDDVGVKHKGFSIREVHVYSDGSPVPTSVALSTKRKTEFLVRVAYRDKWMLLWRVTWAYVVHNAMSEFRRDAEESLEARRSGKK